MKYSDSPTELAEVKAIYYEEGRITPNGANWQYEYTISDHLGNARVSFADADNDGVINKNTEILQTQSYYPFGLEMSGLNSPQVGVENRYKFNGTEEIPEIGWNHTFFRTYDPSIGRWGQIDPKGTERESHYVGLANNPISFLDPVGDTVRYSSSEMRAYVEQYINPTVTKNNGKVKKNKNYDENFAEIVSNLDDSETIYIFTEDKSLMRGETSLGEVNGNNDGSVNIIVPNETGENIEIFGGRGALLAEETYHAFQIENGDAKLTDSGGVVPGDSYTTGKLGLEADAKIFASQTSLTNKKIDNFQNSGFNILTVMGLIGQTYNPKKRNETKALIMGMLRANPSKTYRDPKTGKTMEVTYSPNY